MKKLILVLLLTLGIAGCAKLKGGQLTNSENSLKKDAEYTVVIKPEGAYIKSSIIRVATTQKSTSTQPDASGPADVIKNFKLSQGSLDTLSGISVEFQKAPVKSIFLSILLLAAGVLAWFLGHRITAVGVGAVLVLSLLAPQIMIYGACAIVLLVAVLAYLKYRGTSTQNVQVITSIEKAINTWFEDPAHKEDFRQYIKANQDLATSQKAAEIASKL
jgi:hypothetical protein